MKNKLIRTMAFSSAMSVALVCIRIGWSGNLSFVFLPWNLFLAWIPFLFSLSLTSAVKENRSKWRLRFLFLGWLAFFPNSPYIVTDLFHLHLRAEVPIWFDLILILSFAWNGLLLGFSSLFEIQRFLKTKLSANFLSAFIYCLLIMCSFGIYLGRYPRYNSWDIITSPVELFSDIFNMLIHPFHNTRMVGVTFFFSVFLIVSYHTLNVMINYKKDEQQ